MGLGDDQAEAAGAAIARSIWKHIKIQMEGEQTKVEDSPEDGAT